MERRESFGPLDSGVDSDDESVLEAMAPIIRTIRIARSHSAGRTGVSSVDISCSLPTDSFRLGEFQRILLGQNSK
jgi:hypothetical protein